MKLRINWRIWYAAYRCLIYSFLENPTFRHYRVNRHNPYLYRRTGSYRACLSIWNQILSPCVSSPSISAEPRQKKIAKLSASYYLSLKLLHFISFCQTLKRSKSSKKDSLDRQISLFDILIFYSSVSWTHFLLLSSSTSKSENSKSEGYKLSLFTESEERWASEGVCPVASGSSICPDRLV